MGYNTWGYGGPHEPETYDRRDHTGGGASAPPTLPAPSTSNLWETTPMDIPSLLEIDARLAALAERMYQHAEAAGGLRLRLTGQQPSPKTAGGVDPSAPMSPQSKIMERIQRLNDILAPIEECLDFTRVTLFGPDGPAPGPISGVSPQAFMQQKLGMAPSHRG